MSTLELNFNKEKSKAKILCLSVTLDLHIIGDNPQLKFKKT